MFCYWNSPQGPLRCSFLTRNSNAMESVLQFKCWPQYRYSIWTCHDNATVITYLKFCNDSFFAMLSPVNSPNKGQWHGALMFSLIGVWINGWVNNIEADKLVSALRMQFKDKYVLLQCLLAKTAYGRSLLTAYEHCSMSCILKIYWRCYASPFQ